MSEYRRQYQNRDGVRRTLITDDERPDEATVQTEQVLDEITAGIARDRDRIIPRSTNKLAARLPLFVVEQLINRGIYLDEDAFKKWLNSSEATPWRIWRGDL